MAQRLAALSKMVGRELVVLGIIDGSYREEKATHGKFSHLCAVGEWFEPGDDLLAFIAKETRPWTEDDDEAKRTIAGLCGTRAFGEWLDELVDFSHLGSRTLLVEHALREYAYRHGYTTPQPRR